MPAQVQTARKRIKRNNVCCKKEMTAQNEKLNEK